jgi:hypothetical protein
MRRVAIVAAVIAAFSVVGSPAGAWDSARFELLTRIVHPTHSYLTEYAVGRLAERYPELGTYAPILIEGANSELHELPVEGTAYGIDLEAKRRAHRGTNAGSDDVAGWWKDARAAYAAGNKEQAYYYAGVILHMVQDMGVPAHANGIYHQGTVSEFDNFEAMAALKWEPDFERVDRKDPGYADPSRYYRFSQDWAATDAPDYRDTDTFSKTWLTGDDDERQLLSDRQARTATVTMWTLRAIAKGFGL